MTDLPQSDFTNNTWPSLTLKQWQDTYTTLHLWTQIVGKIRMALSTQLNHWWQSTLYVSPRGLTTGSIPYENRSFQITFDFLEHQLQIDSSDGNTTVLKLASDSVAEFYQSVMNLLTQMDIDVHIWTMPQEVEEPIPFDQDNVHKTYNPDDAKRFWQVLVQVERVFTVFRARFMGKSSPVHFFWGSFDLAVTRFSGRLAPEHPGGVPHMADWVTREAYSHEVSSCGFWPGGGPILEAIFYAYAYPAPERFQAYPVKPKQAHYSSEMQEFILPYEAVRQSESPEETLLFFLQSTYEAAADLGNWDRTVLERSSF